MNRSFSIIALSFFLSVKVFAQTKLPIGELPEVKKYGNGNTAMILIPCMSCRWNEWEKFMERNKNKFTMYAVTLPGYGGTRVPELPTNLDGKTPWRDNALDALSNLIDENGLTHVVVVGHSWGTMVALQLAARRDDVVSKLIVIDGSIESDSWVSRDPIKNKRQLFSVDSMNAVLQDNAEEWRLFNSATYKYRKDSIASDDVEWALKLHGSFMATNKTALHQYWRENIFVDLNAVLHRVKIPILDIQAFAGTDYPQQMRDYQQLMKAAGSPKNVKSVFLYRTGHFVMQHRPEILDEIISSFLTDEKINEVFKF